MLGWLSSWWTDGTIYGPARSAPQNGINIKLFLEQRPTQVIIVSGEEIVTIKNGLRKTEINAVPPLSNKNPIMKEFDEVFAQGYQQYFQKKKQQKMNIEIIISNSEESNSEESNSEESNSEELNSEDSNSKVEIPIEETSTVSEEKEELVSEES